MSAVVLRALAGAGSFVSVYLVGLFVDTLIVGKDFLPILYLMVLVGVLKTVLRFFSKFIIQKTGLAMQQELRLKSFHHLLELDMFWHEKTNTGNKVKRVYAGSSAVERFMWLLSNDIMRLFVAVVGVLVLFGYAHLKYFIFIVVFAIVYVVCDLLFQKPIYRRSKDLHIQAEELGGKAHEVQANVFSVKSLGLHDKMHNILNGQETEYRKRWYRQKYVGMSKSSVVNILTAIGYAVFAYIVGVDVLSGAISVGLVVAYLGYYDKFAGALGNFTNINLTLINLKVQYERLKEILDTPLDNRDDGVVRVSGFKSLRFQNISFGYNKKEVIKNFSLTIRHGEKIGVVGKSGNGKSTLAKLLLRLYVPSKGRILVDTTDLQQIKRSSLRKLITVVPQELEMFNVSLRENISLSTRPDKKKLEHAIKVSCLQPVIEKLPRGLLTVVGERGYRLSGGERQRVAIARAIYRNSPLLILDEATSHLDTKTEKLIQNQLDMLPKTMIVIAHRTSTLENVDRIITM